MPSMHSFVLAAALAFGITALPASAQDAQTNLPRVKLSAGMHQIDAQVAYTPLDDGSEVGDDAGEHDSPAFSSSVGNGNRKITCVVDDLASGAGLKQGARIVGNGSALPDTVGACDVHIDRLGLNDRV